MTETNITKEITEDRSEIYLEGLLHGKDVLVVTADEDVPIKMKIAFLAELATRISTGTSFTHKYQGRGTRLNPEVSLSEPVTPEEQYDLDVLNAVPNYTKTGNITYKDIKERVVYACSKHSSTQLKDWVHGIPSVLESFLTKFHDPYDITYSNVTLTCASLNYYSVNMAELKDMRRGVWIEEDFNTMLKHLDKVKRNDPIEEAKAIYQKIYKLQQDFQCAVILCDMDVNRHAQPTTLMADSIIHLAKSKRGKIAMQVVKARGSYDTGFYRLCSLREHGFIYEQQRSKDRAKPYKYLPKVKFKSKEQLAKAKELEADSGGRWKQAIARYKESEARINARRKALLEADEAFRSTIEAMTPDERAKVFGTKPFVFSTKSAPTRPKPEQEEDINPPRIRTPKEDT